MSAFALIEGPLDAATAWLQIDWTRIQRLVSRLQARIVKAMKAGRWHRVRSLQRLLVSSLRVATINDGQSFTIIDGPKRKAKRLTMGR